MFTGLARHRAEDALLFGVEKKAYANLQLLLRGILLVGGGKVQFNFFMVLIFIPSGLPTH
jgi:hypothetical protein